MNMAKRGRPTDYNKEIAQKICDKMAGGDGKAKSLRTVLAELKTPAMGTVMRWLAENKDFQEQYARACELRGYLYAEDVVDIADQKPVLKKFYPAKQEENSFEIVGIDGAGVQRNRLRCDVRQWYASVCAPKKYGKAAGNMGDQIIDLAAEIKEGRKRAGVKAS